MEKIKRFIECSLPITTCNLRCNYCYITQQRKFDDKWEKIAYSADFIAKEALSIERMGGVCMVNLCAGGETLIPNETVDLTRAFLEEGHYVTIVTNGTITKQFEKIAAFDKDLTERLFIKFSYHYLELKRTNFIEKFFKNIIRVKESGVSIALEITPSDELLPHIEDAKNYALKYLKALPHITIARNDAEPDIPMLTNLTKEDFAKVFDTFNSPMLEFKLPVFGQKRTEFCYAGDWTFCVNLATGDAAQCYAEKSLGNIFDDVRKPVNFCAVGNNCSIAHCYNAHSFLLWGDIVDFTTTTYADIRDRICEDGSHWLTPKMRNFMSSKLQESNKEYSSKQKKQANDFYLGKEKTNFIKKLWKKIKRESSI